MKTKTHAAMAMLLLLCAGFPFAATTYAAPPQTAAGREIAQGKGTVNGVDLEAGTVNIDHDPIPQIRWPRMTMDFQVTDKNLLAGLQAGQKVAFGLVRASPGVYLISHIKTVK